jgi:hypothetical protein
MSSQVISTAGANGESSIQDLFALSDEQILEIQPETELASRESQVATEQMPAKQLPAKRPEDATPISTAPSSTSHEARATSHDAAEPPPWLAAQMQDPWGGEEAREFWDGVQQARSEAAAYRAAFATPEDARALKELYPGGVSEARAVAERARLLDEVDRAYFGGAGNSAEQTSASRVQLAQRMLREDPAAFREMVEAGIRVLQETSGQQSQSAKTLASAVSDKSNNAGPATTSATTVGAQHAAPQLGNPSANEALVAAYAAFERAANEDLERSVGGAIERTLAQALPRVDQHNTPGQAGAQRAAPLQQRLASSVRAEVEKALQNDRQLGEQVAQILAARRFDNDSRAQIVRLISERAQQLVPSAAKRVLNEWTQTTLAAHHGRTQRNDAAVDLAPTSSGQSLDWSGRSKDRPLPPAAAGRTGSAYSPRPINYRKLSDEQILEM